jgi:DNA-binding CsgD family transcriptional regulator
MVRSQTKRHDPPEDAGRNEATEAPPVLSSREREALHHFSNGLTYLQTAHRMGITTRTVDTYLRRVRAKSGAVSTAELTRLAVALERRESTPQ